MNPITLDLIINILFYLSVVALALLTAAIIIKVLTCWEEKRRPESKTDFLKNGNERIIELPRVDGIQFCSNSYMPDQKHELALINSLSEAQRRRLKEEGEE
jgi:hypothetical protein